MKAFKKFPFKASAKKIATLGLVATALVSCGADNNVVDGTNITGSNPVFTNQADQNYWNSLKSKYQCSTGPRLGDMNFQVQSSQGGYAGTVSGQLVPGNAPGTPQGSYVGINAGTKDLVYVTKTSTGAHNVIISLCSWKGTYSNTYFIGGNAQLSNFSISSPLVLSNTGCQGADLVTDGWITFTSSTYGPIPTRFGSYNCL